MNWREAFQRRQEEQGGKRRPRREVAGVDTSKVTLEMRHDHGENFVYASPVSMVVSIDTQGRVRIKEVALPDSPSRKPTQHARESLLHLYPPAEGMQRFDLGVLYPWSKYLSQDCTLFLDIPYERRAADIPRYVQKIESILHSLRGEQVDYRQTASLYRIQLALEYALTSQRLPNIDTTRSYDRRSGVAAEGNEWMDIRHQGRRGYIESFNGDDDIDGDEAITYVVLEEPQWRALIADFEKQQQLFEDIKRYPEKYKGTKAAKLVGRGWHPPVYNSHAHGPMVVQMRERRVGQNREEGLLLSGGGDFGNPQETARKELNEELRVEPARLTRLCSGNVWPNGLRATTTIFYTDNIRALSQAELEEKSLNGDEIYPVSPVLRSPQEVDQDILLGRENDVRMITARAFAREIERRKRNGRRD